MRMSKYALKKRAETLRYQIASFGFSTPGQLISEYAKHCATENGRRSLPDDALGRRGHEVLWLERMLANATNSHQTRAMKSLHTSKQQEGDDAPNH